MLVLCFNVSGIVFNAYNRVIGGCSVTSGIASTVSLPNGSLNFVSGSVNVFFSITGFNSKDEVFFCE
jgi:hypothetical protein